MDAPDDRSWGLRRRLMALACLPFALALAGVLLVERLGHADVRAALDRRAALVATALAEASEYGLISGNAAALDRTVRQLMRQDGAIATIEILDAARRPFIALSGPHSQPGQAFTELPVRSSVPDIDFFDRTAPHVSLVDEVQPSFRPGPVAGYVRVAMSPAPLAQVRRERLAWQLGVLAVAALVGVLLAARWGRRLGSALDSAAEALRRLRQGRATPPDLPAWSDDGPRELRRLQAAVLALAEDGPPHAPRPVTPAAPLPEDPMARRIAGRLDAALIAVRLSARHIAHVAGQPAAAPETERAQHTVLGILALAEQVGAAGEALFEPWRADLVQALGLQAALQALVAACGEAHPGCRFHLQADAPLPPLAPAQAVLLHRVVHEALAHATACSGAACVTVTLLPPTPPGDLRVRVHDDGEATPAAASATRLDHLSRRLAEAGGRCELSRAAGAGTTLLLRLAAVPGFDKLSPNG